jgi:hypothetical protein
MEVTLIGLSPQDLIKEAYRLARKLRVDSDPEYKEKLSKQRNDWIKKKRAEDAEFRKKKTEWQKEYQKWYYHNNEDYRKKQLEYKKKRYHEKKALEKQKEIETIS